MKRLQCKCGSERFNADRNEAYLRCAVCFQRYMRKALTGPWFEISAIEKLKEDATRILISTANKPFEWADYILHHPKHEKKAKKELLATRKVAFGLGSDEFPVKAVDIEKRIRAGWIDEIKLLDHGEKLYFPNYAHKGRLRGKDIAKTCHRDLTRIGLKTKISFDDDGASLEIQHD